MSGHKLYTSKDFEKMSWEEQDGNFLYDCVVNGGLNFCKVCGEAESGLDKPCRPNAEEESGMKKDKEWLKEEVWKQDTVMSKGYIYTDDLMSIINELDEPEKPFIPKFVADWIEEERVKTIDWHTEIPERFFLILVHKLHYTTLASTNIGDWVFGGNEEKLHQALKYGYEVEKEKLYRVCAGNRYVRFNLDGSIVGVKKDNSIVCLERLSKLPFDYKKAVESGIITLEECEAE